MKHLLFALIFMLLGFTNTAFAQWGGNGSGNSGGGHVGKFSHQNGDGNDAVQHEKPTPEMIAFMQTEQLKKDIALTVDQEKKAKQLNLVYAQKVDEQLKMTPEMNDYSKAMISKFKTDRDGELKAILTTEQWEVYTQKEKQREQQRAQNRAQRK